MKVRVGAQRSTGEELLTTPAPQAPPAPPAAPSAPPAHVPAAVLNQLLRAAERRALDVEERLIKILIPILNRAADEAARGFTLHATSITAAGDPRFSAPGADQVIDVDSLIATLRGKTDPVRQAVVETMMSPAMGAVDLSFDVHNPFVARVLEQSGSQIVGIGQTTQLNVMRIIRGAHEQGLSIPSTAEAIQKGMRSASEARATLIARTELAGAVNGGAQAVAEIVAGATGDSYMKTWLCAPGAKFPRHETYDGLDGQQVGLEETFSVGDDELNFPGDPDGSIEETANCRCTMVLEDGAGNTIDAGDADSGFSLADLGVLAGEGEGEGAVAAESAGEAGAAEGEVAGSEGEAAAAGEDMAAAEPGSFDVSGSDQFTIPGLDYPVTGPDEKLLSIGDERIAYGGVKMEGAFNGAHYEDLSVAAQATLKAEYDAALKNVTATAPLMIRAPTRVVGKIIDEGRFKSQFETGKSQGMMNHDVRARAEQEMFGYPKDLPVELRPIYGYLDIGKSSESATGYGDAAFKLKESVRARTTHAWTDSLNAGVAPSRVTNPSWRSVRDPHDIGRMANSGDPNHAIGAYAEAQYHGGLTLADVAEARFEMVLPTEALDDAATAARRADFEKTGDGPRSVYHAEVDRQFKEAVDGLTAAYRTGDAEKITEAERAFKKKIDLTGDPELLPNIRKLTEAGIPVVLSS